MSQSNEGEQALAYVADLKRAQERVILSGTFTRIEEYRAATAVVRNLGRIHDQIAAIYQGKEAAQAIAEDSLQPMPEENK